MASPNIDINAVPCGDPSHNAVSRNTALEMHIRANCTLPKVGAQVKDGRYWTLQTRHREGAVEQKALESFHQSMADAWKKDLYPKAAGAKENFGVLSVKDSADSDEEWEMVEKKDADEDEEEVKSASGQRVLYLKGGLRKTARITTSGILTVPCDTHIESVEACNGLQKHDPCDSSAKSALRIGRLDLHGVAAQQSS